MSPDWWVSNFALLVLCGKLMGGGDFSQFPLMPKELAIGCWYVIRLASPG